MTNKDQDTATEIIATLARAMKSMLVYGALLFFGLILTILVWISDVQYAAGLYWFTSVWFAIVVAINVFMVLSIGSVIRDLKKKYLIDSSSAQSSND